MTQNSGDWQPGDNNNNKQRSVQRGAVYLFSTALVFFILSVFISFAPSPIFCRLCHINEYRTWQKSSHKSVSCNECHRREDFFSVAGYRISVVRMTGHYLTYFFYDKPIRADIPNGGCLSCHDDLSSKTITAKSLIMSHKEPVDNGYDCTYCHSKVVHKKLVPSSRQFSMNKCFVCHDGFKAENSCNTCHETVKKKWLFGKFLGPWQYAHSKDWRRLHGTGGLNSCRTCHSGLFCSRCHGIPMPHPDSWLNDHGPIAKNNRKICLTCHTEKLCNKCHLLNLNHNKTWLQRHFGVVKKIGSKPCLKCHLQDGCDRCHILHMHPGLPYQFMKKLRKEAGLK
jgi:hypothetical protein